MKKTILFLLCLWAFPACASHIVGGEFELVYISGNSYRLNLILYFDALNGSAGARDPGVDARIFRKRDDAVMMNVFLPFVSEAPVTYTQPACANGKIETTRMLYSRVITLSPQQFSDAAGYYVAWERCCRNYKITNVYSDDPTIGGNYAGQTFYLEFPPVVKDGVPFINSSPRLFPPLSDYACPNRPYYVDFAGTDNDGDSLVYTIVTPLNTKTADALPLPDLRPRPQPYPLVNFRPPFGQDNIMAGAPDLRISRDGFLTVTPTVLGLYVFAVRCEEFRNGEKIGEVRRDFQMLVVDDCNPAYPPEITGKKPADVNGHLNVSFSNDVPDAERCIQVEVSDLDALREADGFTENITIRAMSLDFKSDVSGILPEVTAVTLTHGSTATFDICFDRCPYVRNGPFQVGIVAYDDACSLPLTDTLKVTVNIEPPENKHAYFTTGDVHETLTEGTGKSWDIAARDDDGDSLVLSVVTDGFNLADAGMEIQQVEQADGSYKAQFVWDPRCDVYDFTGRTAFDVTLLVDDVDACGFSDPDVMHLHLEVALPDNAPPVISSDLTETQLEEGVSLKVFETLTFNVYGDDADANAMQLYVEGVDFDLADYGMAFPLASGTGHVTSPFSWSLLCQQVKLAEKDDFALRFIVVDNVNKCRVHEADTLNVMIKVAPPANAAPLLTISSTNGDLPFENGQQDLLVGQSIALAITATDTDVSPADRLVIELVSAEGNVAPDGYHFEAAEGVGSAQTTFTWNPDCAIFSDGLFENHYKFVFRTYDDRCQSGKADTVAVEFTVRDVEREIPAFLPPNFVSADDDPGQHNEFFGMVRLNEQTGMLEDVMPKDNCVRRFVGVTIFNRWGTRVFESNRRDFRWYPDDVAAGIYFYTLTFSDRSFKGSITVRK